jgi:hypothetical protein
MARVLTKACFPKLQRTKFIGKVLLKRLDEGFEKQNMRRNNKKENI